MGGGSLSCVAGHIGVVCGGVGSSFYMTVGVEITR